MRYLLLPLILSILFWIASVSIFNTSEQRLAKQACQIIAVVFAGIFTAILILDGLLNAH